MCAANRVKLVFLGELVAGDGRVLGVGVLLEDAEEGREDERDGQHGDALGKDRDVVADGKLGKALDRRGGGKEDAGCHGKDSKDLAERVALVEEQHAEHQTRDKRAAAEDHVEGHCNVVAQRLVVEDAHGEEQRDICRIEAEADLPRADAETRRLARAHVLDLAKKAHHCNKHELPSSQCLLLQGHVC